MDIEEILYRNKNMINSLLENWIDPSSKVFFEKFYEEIENNILKLKEITYEALEKLNHE